MTVADLAAETLPFASLTQAYTVFVPLDENTNLEGIELFQPAVVAVGFAALSVSRYPATPILSAAVNVDTCTVVDADDEGILKPVITGAVVSGRVMVTEAVLADDTLPAASFTQL